MGSGPIFKGEFRRETVKTKLSRYRSLKNICAAEHTDAVNIDGCGGIRILRAMLIRNATEHARSRHSQVDPFGKHYFNASEDIADLYVNVLIYMCMAQVELNAAKYRSRLTALEYGIIKIRLYAREDGAIGFQLAVFIIFYCTFAGFMV